MRRSTSRARSRGRASTCRGSRSTVAGQDDGDPLTLERLIDGLRGGVDILYLVCHGGLTAKGPLLYLQAEDGTAMASRGDEFAQRVGELVERPRLVVLASCESAGSEQMSTQSSIAAGQLVPLAPALAEAGVHAVLAMQGKISMETVKTAMPVFFAELLEDGQIDRAFAVARGKVRQRPDSWMPALFLRLKGGRIWYEPGFGDGEGDFDKWEALVGAVRGGTFTPIVGPGLGESVYGSLRDVSRELAGGAIPARRAPALRAPAGRAVRAVQPGRRHRAGEVQGRAAPADPAETRIALGGGEGAEPLEAHGAGRAAQPRADPDDPYRRLAQLDAKLFVTANPDNMLEEALRAEGKTPETFFFNWRKQDAGGRGGKGGGRRRGRAGK